MKCHKEDAPLLGLMGQSMRLVGKRAQELYAEYDLNSQGSYLPFIRKIPCLKKNSRSV